MSDNNENKGMTIKGLKAFLNRLPEEFDDFSLVNGEVFGVDEYYVRVDKPIVHIEVDEKSGEMLFLHQSEEELGTILKEIESYGDTEGPEQ